MSWTRKLPTVDGFYWFREENRMTPERGIALVDVIHREAKILIWSDSLDDTMYVSDAYWNLDETHNESWEWYGPIHAPR